MRRCTLAGAVMEKAKRAPVEKARSYGEAGESCSRGKPSAEANAVPEGCKWSDLKQGMAPYLCKFGIETHVLIDSFSEFLNQLRLFRFVCDRLAYKN